MFLVGCFDDANPIGPTPVERTDTAKVDTVKIPGVDSFKITGKINLSNAGGIDVGSIKVSGAGITTIPNADGSYILSGAIKSKVLGRVASDSILDTVKIIVAGDTMVEIPVTSWKSVLPTNYIVQRNVGCVIPNNYIGSTVQAVYWDNDSIASVLNLGKTTSKNKFSGFIYTAYNDSQFINQLSIYSLFVRIKKNDSVVANTEVTDVTAEVGNLDYDSTQFENVKSYIKYLYTVIPNDSNVKNYMDTIRKELVVDTTFDTVRYSFTDTNNVTIPYFFSDTTMYSTEDSSLNMYGISSILKVMKVDTVSSSLTIRATFVSSDPNSGKGEAWKTLTGFRLNDTLVSVPKITWPTTGKLMFDLRGMNIGVKPNFSFSLETVMMTVKKYYR
jgi:hypothetical protein